MTKLKILGPKGHEEFEDIKPEEAKEIIEQTQKVWGKRFFIVDQATKRILKELKIAEDQELMMIPMIEGG